MEQGIHDQNTGLPALAALLAGRTIDGIEGWDESGPVEILEKTLGYPRKNGRTGFVIARGRKDARAGWIVPTPVAG